MEVTLRCMGVGLSPGELQEYPLAVDTDIIVVIQIYEDEFGRSRLRRQTEQDGSNAGERILARIQSFDCKLVLEPLVKGISVEPPPLFKFARNFDSKGMEIPPSTPHVKNFVYLRPGDTINLSHEGLKIDIAVEDHNGALKLSQRPSERCEEEILVKSSNIEPEAVANRTEVEDEPQAKPDDDVPELEAALDHDGPDSGSDDDDLDNMSTGGATKTLAAVAGELTPPTECEPTIKETPHHEIKGENEPYSTAPDQQTDDAHPEESDSASKQPVAVEGKIELSLTEKLKSAANEESQARAGESLNRAIKASLSTSDTADEPETEDESEDTPSRPPTRTYGRKGERPTTPHNVVKRRNTVVSMGTSDEGDQEPIAQHGYRSVDHEDSPAEASDLPPTSESVNSSSVAVEAARRSLPIPSAKRKAEEHPDETHLESKKRKSKVSKTPSSSEQSDHPGKHSSKSRKGRLPKAAFDTGSSGEITVIPRKGRATETPDESTAALVGKPPKVLLSSENNLPKSALKWLEAQGAEIINEVKSRRTDFVCVVTDDKTRTARVLRSVTLGKAVVGEEWVVQSKKAGHLLDTVSFVHKDLQGTADLDRRGMFEGKNLYFTHSLEKMYGKNWNGIKELANEAGASYVDTGDAKKLAAVQGRNETIIFGSDKMDIDVAPLVNDYGFTVYSKDLLPHSILTGELDLDSDEFKLSAGRPAKKGKK